MKCKICGFELSHGETFCRNCGASNTNEDIKNVGFEEIKSIQPLDKNQIEKDIKKNNGQILFVIGIVVTILALMVVIYLIYSTLKTKDSQKTNVDIAVLTTNNYYINYKNRVLTLNSEIKIKVYDDYLELTCNNYKSKLMYEGDSSYDQVDLDVIKNAYLESNDYVLQEPTLKTNDTLSYYRADVDYNNGNKSAFILVADKLFGYWIMEIGTIDFQDYPNSEIVDEVIRLAINAKNVEEENKLNLDFLKVKSNALNFENSEHQGI